MIEHTELKEAYKKRHAHKRQYLSSWAKAKVRTTAINCIIRHDRSGMMLIVP